MSDGHGVSSASRDDAELLLVGEDLIAHSVPAHAELALEFVDPSGRWVMRRMRAARCVVKEERLLRIELIELVEITDRHRRPYR